MTKYNCDHDTFSNVRASRPSQTDLFLFGQARITEKQLPRLVLLNTLLKETRGVWSVRGKMHLRTPYWWIGVRDPVSCQVASVIPTKTSGSVTRLGGREGRWAKRGDQVRCTSVRRVSWWGACPYIGTTGRLLIPRVSHKIKAKLLIRRLWQPPAHPPGLRPYKKGW